jgi:methylamine---glutamate N-methyltransferase subunit C
MSFGRSKMTDFVNKILIAKLSEIEERTPTYALVANVDLVVIKYDNKVSVLYGRCLHRGALLSDGFISGDNLICGLHFWDYRIDTGNSEYNNEEQLQEFSSWIDEEADAIFIDENEIIEWEKENPQPYYRNNYLGLYADIHGTPKEPNNSYIHKLAKQGAKRIGKHGVGSAMGVPITELPKWDDIQLLTAQLARKPLFDDAEISTELIIGPNAKKPLKLNIPIFISDMSFGALSEEAKVALAMGAELSGTGICSGEGGMLPEEHENNSKYFYELASAKFGWNFENVKNVQAFHFKAGQGAKTGTGGHLPGDKVKG